MPSEPEEGELTDQEETTNYQNNHSTLNQQNHNHLNHDITPNQTLNSGPDPNSNNSSLLPFKLTNNSPSISRSSPSNSALTFSNVANGSGNEAYAPAIIYSVPSTTATSSNHQRRDGGGSGRVKPAHDSRLNRERDLHQSPSNQGTRSEFSCRTVTHGKSPRHPTSSPYYNNSSYQHESRRSRPRSRNSSPDRWRPPSRSSDRYRADQSPRDRRISPSRFSSPPLAYSPHSSSRAPTRSPRSRTPTVNNRYPRSPSRTSHLSRSPSSRHRTDRPPSDIDHHHLMPRARRRSRSYTPERSLSWSRSPSRGRRRSPSRDLLPLPTTNVPIFTEPVRSTMRQQPEPIGDPEKPQVSVISSVQGLGNVEDKLGQQLHHSSQERAQQVQPNQISPQAADPKVGSHHKVESQIKPSESVDQIDGLTLAPSDISSPRISSTNLQITGESTLMNHEFTYTNYDQAYSWKREPTSVDVSKRTPKDEEMLDVDMDIVPANMDEKSVHKLSTNQIARKHFIGVSPISAYELIEKLGEGTFGEVYKAIYRGRRYARKMKMDALTNKGATTASLLDESSDDDDEDDPDGIIPELGMSLQIGMTVAVKRIIVHNELDGLPITSLREIRILKSLQHPNVVPVVDIAYSQGSSSLLRRGNTYMVFPYIDHDLAGLMENKSITFSVSQIKLYSKQLLLGTAYLHRNRILHRDLKAANLLISNAGQLLIADFGLARSIAPGDKREYTTCVVTRWYRPPEILLGDRRYGTPVDMWGVGCVIGEMFKGGPILTGNSDVNQCELIFRLCGSPTIDSMPGWESLPGCEGVRSWAYKPRRVREEYQRISSELADLLDRLLVLDASKRLTAEDALDHDWFWTDPMAIDPAKLQHYEASHEYDRRKKDEPAKKSMQNQFATFTGLQPITSSKPAYPPQQQKNQQAPVINPLPMRSDVHHNQVPPLGNLANPPPPTSFLPRASIPYQPPHHGPSGGLDSHSVPPSLPLSNQPGLQMHNTYPHQPPGMMPTQGQPLHLTQGVGGPPLPYRDPPNQYGQQMNTNMLPANGYKMPHQNPRSGNMVPPPSSAHDHYHQPRNSRNQPPPRPQPFHQLPGQRNLALPPRPMLSYVETSVNEPIPHKASTFNNNLYQPNMPPNPLYAPPGVLNGPPAPAPMLPQSSIAPINHNHRGNDRPPRDTYIPGGGQDGYSNNMRNGNGTGSRNQNDRRYNRNNNNNHNHNDNNNNVNGRDRWTPSNSSQALLHRQRGEHRNRQNDGRRGGGGNRQSWPINSFNGGDGGGNGDYMQGASQRSDGDWNNSLGPPPPPPHPHPHPHPHHPAHHPSHSHSSSNGIEPPVPFIRYAERPQDDGPHLEY